VDRSLESQDGLYDDVFGASGRNRDSEGV